MALQLSHPQAYFCGFCTFTSPDYRVLVKHLVDHTVFKEKKHEHVLWCGLCKPGANHIDGHQQAMTSEDHLNGSTYRDNNDLGYGDMSNYSEYNGLYNPYAFPNAYYYPMNVAYSNPCYVNGYYQSEGTTFYTDNFYGGSDVFPTVNTPSIIESAPENLLDSPHSSENIRDVDSCSAKSLNDMTLPDLEDRSKGSNSVNYDSSIETLSDPQNFPTENSSNKSDYKELIDQSIGEMGTFSKSTANSDLNVAQIKEFETISNIKPPAAEVNKGSIQPTSDKTLSIKLNSSQPKKVSTKEISNPKRNAVKRNPPQTNVHRANDSETVPKDLTESSNLVFLSETVSKCVGSSIVDTKSAIKDSISMNDNTQAISAPNKEGCNSKLPSVKISEPYENDVAKASSTDEQTPDSYPEAARIKEIIINDASDVKNYSISVKVDTLSEKVFRKESNSHLHTSERGASSENFLGKGSILAQDMNVSSVSDANSSPKVYTAILTDDASKVKTGSIDVNCPLTKIDLNGIHSEYPTGKLENLPKTNNSISVSKKDGLVPAAKFSPKINVSVTVRGNSVSDIQIKSNGMKDDQRPKNKLYGNKPKMPSERDGRMKLKSRTREYDLNRNSRQEDKINSSEAVTKSSKKCQSDETEALSNVRNSVRNSCQSDLNYTNRNCRPVPNKDQFKVTYAELVRRWSIEENRKNCSST